MAKTYTQLIDEARHTVPEVTVEEVQQRIDRGEHWTLLDVREREEYRAGHLEGALSLPRGLLELRVEEAVPDKSTPLLAYCASGVRSLMAARTLKGMGYEEVVSLAGGYTAWKNAGNRWVADRQFTLAQLTHYTQYFTLPEVGETGQATVFYPGRGPCYRCVFPEPPPPGAAPVARKRECWVSCLDWSAACRR